MNRLTPRRWRMPDRDCEKCGRKEAVVLTQWWVPGEEHGLPPLRWVCLNCQHTTEPSKEDIEDANRVRYNTIPEYNPSESDRDQEGKRPPPKLFSNPYPMESDHE